MAKSNGANPLPALPQCEKKRPCTALHEDKEIRMRGVTSFAPLVPERELGLIPVRPDHKRFLFDLANDDAVRAASFQRPPIAWGEHCRWFAHQLAMRFPFYIGLLDGLPCGYVRFRPHPDDENEAEASIAVHMSHRGRGVGTRLLALACRTLLTDTSIRRIDAWVKSDNLPSLHLFEKNGFQATQAAVHHGFPALHLLYPAKARKTKKTDTDIRRAPGITKQREPGLIPVTPDDKHFLSDLANGDAVCAISFQQPPVPWKEHCCRFAHPLIPRFPFYMGLLKGLTLGYIRFRPHPDAASEAEVSIAVHMSHRNRGVETRLPALTCRTQLTDTSVLRIDAWVKSDKLSSPHLFEKNGFPPIHTAAIHGFPALHLLYLGKAGKTKKPDPDMWRAYGIHDHAVTPGRFASITISTFFPVFLFQQHAVRSLYPLFVATPDNPFLRRSVLPCRHALTLYAATPSPCQRISVGWSLRHASGEYVPLSAKTTSFSPRLLMRKQSQSI